MQIDRSKKTLIELVVNRFETGRPDGDYGAISIHADGPHDIRPITYGRPQTTEYGNLRELLFDYVKADGANSAELEPFAEKVGGTPLTNDFRFKRQLRKAGREDSVMRAIQDQFFERKYYVPDLTWAKKNRFSLPLSALAIYDSFIQSGSILWVIRQKFSERPPVLGGEEKSWIKAYQTERHDWLLSHRRPTVRTSVHRVVDLKCEVKAGNWELNSVPIWANGVQVDFE